MARGYAIIRFLAAHRRLAFLVAVVACVAGATFSCTKKRGPGAAAQAQSSARGSNAGGGNDCPSHEPLSGPDNGAACETCTKTNCALTGGGDSGGCCALSDPKDQQLCFAVASCFQSPARGEPIPCTRRGDVVNCFCGMHGGAECFSTLGAADGPCAAEVIAAAKSSSPTVIHARFTDAGSPLGRAVNLLSCRGNFCQVACEVH